MSIIEELEVCSEYAIQIVCNHGLKGVDENYYTMDGQGRILVHFGSSVSLQSPTYDTQLPSCQTENKSLEVSPLIRKRSSSNPPSPCALSNDE